VFVEEKSCHIVTENTTPQSREKATATEKIIKEDGNDEPEIIFASESHVVSSSVSKPETAAATSDEPLSTEQDTPVTIEYYSYNDCWFLLSIFMISG
jgi:hypothetical protein